MTIEEAKQLKPGDRVRDKANGYEANVLGLNNNGFEYEFDQPISFIPRWGMTMTGGRVYWDGVQFWEKISNASS
jgi:hypothetical protein